MRLFLGSPPNVEKLARKGNIEGLVRALRYEDIVRDREGRLIDLGATVRAAAARSLALLDSPKATNALVQALSDPLEAVRMAAIRGLREHGGNNAAERLMAAVAGWTRPEYAAAREDALEAVMVLEHPETLRLTTGAMMMRDTELDDRDLAVVRRLAGATSDADVRATIGDLVGRLRESSANERTRRVLITLAPHSVDALIEALDDKRTRRDAALALGPIHDSRAVPALSSMLLDSAADDVRAAAAWALGEIRHPSAIEALLVATGDDDYDVRTAAADSFDKLGNAAIALAMNVIARPALENGGGDPGQAISAESTASGVDGVSRETPETASTEVISPPAWPRQRWTASGTRPLGERARPLLRRLLGRDLPPR
ncbi:MAG: HEAT repeat domain-containing protein [Actinobacteria bacterium]|nr:HEAT repeat domain-containing protein [Actinomycetota bacterium]